MTALAMAGSTPAWSSPPGTARPIEPRNFNRSFDRCIIAARVPRITVHGTRKTCASLLAALDVHPRVAMRILRHSKIAVTMEIYTEAPSDATRDALRKLGDWLTDRCCRLLLPEDQKGRFPDGNRPLTWVELRGFEPLTPSMRTERPTWQSRCCIATFPHVKDVLPDTVTASDRI